MIALLLALLLAEPAPSRPGLADLAYALGEAHALRQGCRGRSDGYWRGRMSAVIDLEQPGREQKLQLVERFNTGFAAARTAHPTCNVESRATLSDVLARAASLARGLGR